jgi:GntR family transcriptional regulator
MERVSSALQLAGHDRRRDEARRLRDLLNTILERTQGNPARLPDERLISKGFGMSRNSVREALHLLADEGRIERNVGSGSFARMVPARNPFDRIVDFSKADRDIRADTRAESMGFRMLSSVPETLRDALRLPEGVALAIFERIVRRDDVPVELRTHFLPLREGDHMTAEDVLGDVYELIEVRFRRPIARATRAVSALAADPSSADVLKVELGSPLLLMESTLVDAAGDVVMVTYGRHRSDRMTVTFSAERIPPTD